MDSSPVIASIHIIDNDSLLNVFYLYRPFLLGEDDDNEDSRVFGGAGQWDRGHWWYKIAHVCRRWRNVVLESAAYLGISLVCTNGTPVADMLAYSPPLPLVVDYSLREDSDITTEDEEGAILALKQYNRVRHVRLIMPATSLQKFIVAMDDEYPILQYLIIWNPAEGNLDQIPALIFPETLQAPHLCHLLEFGFALPIGSRLLMNAVGLVTLGLFMDHPSTYFQPDTLLHWLSFMPQLETLLISFDFPVPNHEVEWLLAHTPIPTPNALPNLLVFKFKGVTSYLEALVHRINAPRLEKLELEFFNQLMYSFPCLLRFLSTAENLRFKSAQFTFNDKKVYVDVYPHEDAKMCALSIDLKSWHLDWQVSSAAQIFNSLSSVFSAVEHLALEHRVHSRSSEEHNEADRTEWRKLLNSFRNVKTLRVAEGLVEELTRCLELDDEEPPLGMFPELQELTYSGSGNTGGAFSSFINARRDAGRPVTLLRRSPSPDSSSRASSLEPPLIISASGEAGSDLDT